MFPSPGPGRHRRRRRAQTFYTHSAGILRPPDDSKRTTARTLPGQAGAATIPRPPPGRATPPGRHGDSPAPPARRRPGSLVRGSAASDSPGADKSRGPPGPGPRGLTPGPGRQASTVTIMIAASQCVTTRRHRDRPSQPDSARECHGPGRRLPCRRRTVTPSPCHDCP
jgi:hypothetical protein